MNRLMNNKLTWAVVLVACFVGGCSSDDDDASAAIPPTDEETVNVEAYVLATSVADGDKTANLLLTSESLTEGTISPINNGLVNDGATEWVFYNDRYLYALTYNQGNAGTTRSYVLDSDGQMRARSAEYKVSRFTSFGKFGDYLMASSTGDGPTAFADAEGHLPQMLLLTYLNVQAETATSNDTSLRDRFMAENFLGNGEYVTLSGFVEANGKLYCGVVGMGLSPYGTAAEGGAYIRPGYEDLVKTESGGTGSGAYEKGELQGTQYPDECWVALFDDEQLNGCRLIKTDKISYPCGRYRSQYYQSVWAADNGDVYVFSSSYAKTLSDPRQQTTLPAGVVRIKAGASTFDANYYYNLEAQSEGCSFLRCWPAGGNYFLLRMYDRPFAQTGYVANQLALFNGDNGKLTFVSGLPEASTITDFGKMPYVEGDYVYLPVMTSVGYPAIYRIHTPTATATRGTELQVSTVTAVGKMQVIL